MLSKLDESEESLGEGGDAVASLGRRAGESGRSREGCLLLVMVMRGGRWDGKTERLAKV